MKNTHLPTKTLLALTFVLLISPNLFAQAQQAKSTSANKKTIIFKVPDSFLQAPMNPDKKGLMMLNPKKPAGTFVVYTPDNQKSDDFAVELRKMFARMFMGDKNVDLKWKETILPKHEKVENETGKIFTTNSGDNEIQVVAYTRTISEGQDVIYGYFAMRDTKGKKDSAEFINEQGKGVKEFESFWKTVEVSKK